MNLRIVLNGNLEKSFGAMNGFAAHPGSRYRHVNLHDALHSKVYTAGDQR